MRRLVPPGDDPSQPTRATGPSEPFSQSPIATRTIALVPTATPSETVMKTAGPHPNHAVRRRVAHGRKNTPVSASTIPDAAITTGVIPAPYSRLTPTAGAGTNSTNADTAPNTTTANQRRTRVT